MFIQDGLSSLSTLVLYVYIFYVVVNGPPNALRQQRSVIPITSGKKQSQGKHKGIHTVTYILKKVTK